MKYESASSVNGRTTSFNQTDTTAFYLINKRQMIYVPRYWIVNDKNEYMYLLNYLCQIDMIVHPDIIQFPQKYELINNKNCPELKPIGDKQ